MAVICTWFMLISHKMKTKFRSPHSVVPRSWSIASLPARVRQTDICPEFLRGKAVPIAKRERGRGGHLRNCCFHAALELCLFPLISEERGAERSKVLCPNMCTCLCHKHDPRFWTSSGKCRCSCFQEDIQATDILWLPRVKEKTSITVLGCITLGEAQPPRFTYWVLWFLVDYAQVMSPWTLL